MKAKRLLSVVLAAMMVLSCAMVMGVSSVSAEETAASTYAKFQESIKPENNYGLTDTVNEGKILQAWNWSYKNTIALMEQVAQQGFTTIQISPPNEIKMPTKGVAVCAAPVDGIAPNGWWMFYQPAGFQLNESEDNALGTKAEFVEMCAEAKKYGIKILVDAVINHMGTDDDHVGLYDNDSTDPMDHVNPRAAEFEPELLAAKAFHSPWKDMTYVENLGQSMRLYDAQGKPLKDANGNYRTGGSATEKDIEESLTQHCTSGLPDLATETQLVQDTIYDYLKELIDAGADGFRFDAAKHIETTHDTYFPSKFWENTLLKLRDENPGKEIFAYGEILNKCGDGRPFSEYTELMDVTDSSSFWGIKDAVCNNGNGGNATPKYPNANFTKENVIQWNESHDTYIDGGTSYFTVQQRNKIWALTAARQEITGVYFARPDDRTGANRAAIEKICENIILGDANVTSWANAEVKAVNQFDNFFGSAEEFCRTKDKVTLIERFDREAGLAGATLVNLGGTTKTVSITVRNLPDGNYIESITGNTFTVVDGTLTGQIGNTGIACLYSTDDTVEFPEIDNSVVTMEQLYEGMAKWDASTGEYPVVPGANTVVYSAQSSWTKAYVYAWMNGTEDNLGSWPGNEMTFALKNEYGENQFYTMIPVEYDCYIINNGNGAQTVDLSVTESTGMYMSTMSGGKYTIGTWSPNFTELTVSEFLGKTDNTTEPPTSEPPVVEPTVILGDADGNETVNVKDATAIQKIVAGLEVAGYVEAAADANEDGSVNVKDATAIQKWVAGLLEGSNIGK